MNNEIKEILDRLDYNEWEVDLYKVPITWCELYDIRDYITNLQKTNKNHSKKLIELGDKITNLQQENERLKDSLETMTFTAKVKQEAVDSLISRMDKAIEYFKYQLENLDFYEDTKARMLCAMGITLLQNGSDSQ